MAAIKIFRNNWSEFDKNESTLSSRHSDYNEDSYKSQQERYSSELISNSKRYEIIKDFKAYWSKVNWMLSSPIQRNSINQSLSTQNEFPRYSWVSSRVDNSKVSSFTSGSSVNLLPVQSIYSPKFTLVLDLDETLIHSIDLTAEDPWYLIRPFAVKFLKEVSKYYEIVIFTAGVKSYADPIIDDIDEWHVVSHRLYRHHTYGEGEEYIKDLALLGRDLRYTLIVDNTKDNFKNQIDNGIQIRSWFGNYDDDKLKMLRNLLIEIVERRPKDLREELKKLRTYVIKNIE